MPVLDKVESDIRDNIRDIAWILFSLAHLDEVRIVVVPLSGKDVPVIEARRVAFEMPLADHDCLVPGLLEEFGKCLLRAVKPQRVVPQAIEMTVLSGQDYRATGSADAVGAEAVLELDPLFRDAVDIRSCVDSASVAAHGMGGMVVTHDKKDVRFFGPGFFSTQTAGNSQ